MSRSATSSATSRVPWLEVSVFEPPSEFAMRRPSRWRRSAGRRSPRPSPTAAPASSETRRESGAEQASQNPRAQLTPGFAGNKLGQIRDNKGKPVAQVFATLPGSQKAQILRALAFKVLGSMT